MSASRIVLGVAVLAAAALASVAGKAGAEPFPASPWVELHASRIRLVAAPAPAPGQPLIAGIEIVLADGWKTYWRMPGDAGVPPSFDWKGSTNVGAVKVLYPAPMRLPEAGGEAIGYKKSVIFPVEIVPEDPTKPVALKLAIEFGVCREICIPAEATMALGVEAGRKGAIPRDLAGALERVPRTAAARRGSDPQLQRASIAASGTGSRLLVEARFPKGARGTDLFIEAPEGLFVPLAKKVSEDAAGIVRFGSDLGPDLFKELKGRTLTFTLVSETGASETQWTVP